MGIWPPSKPLIATPERAFCPLTPRPAVLPLPDPIPRPTRMRSFVEPGLSLNSFSFIICSPGSAECFPYSLLRVDRNAVFLDDADEMRNLINHAANGRIVGDDPAAVHLVKAKADQRLFLIVGPADRATNL